MEPFIKESCHEATLPLLVDANPEQERRRIKLVSASALTGAIVGFVVQSVTFGAFIPLLKLWGRDKEIRNRSELLIYGVLALLSQLDVILYFGLWMTFTCLLTKMGSSYLRKKFDIEESTDSLWTGRFLFRFCIWFLGGLLIGSFLGWITVDFMLGGPVPMMPFVSTLIFDLILCLLMLVCYEWGHPSNPANADKEDEENSFFV